MYIDFTLTPKLHGINMLSKEQTSDRRGSQAPIYLDAERRQQALARIMREPTVDMITARCALGIGEHVARREAANLGGQKIGKRYVFSSAKLRQMLGLAASTAA